MSEPRFKFSGLRELLLDLGFQEIPVSKSNIGFRHEASDTFIVLPSYRSNSHVAPHHLAQVRIMLDAKGLLVADEFDRLAGHFSTPHSASS